MTLSNAKFSYVDLFAGIGGFAAVFEALGGRSVYSVEIDEKAAKVYELNWGHSPLGDITKDANDSTMVVPQHDILAAGFPCQPFSKSGAQRGMEETRGTLYWNILKIIKAHHPAIVLLENVRNLAGPRHLHEWEVIIETLRSEGYVVSDKPAIFSPHLLPKANGGRPQVRERVFITATYAPEITYRGEGLPPLVTSKEGVEGWNPANWNLFKDLPLDSVSADESTALSASEVAWIDAWDDWVKSYKIANGSNPPGFPIWVDAWVELSRLSIPDETPKWKADFLYKNSKLYTENKDLFDDWIERHSVLTDLFPPSRRKLEWQAQDAVDLWSCVMHFRPSGIRAKKPNYLPALVAITQTSIIGPLRRRLSVREAARLQGLPEWFSFGQQANSMSYKQLGNGVNIGAVWHVLKSHVERDSEYLQLSKPGRELVKVVLDSPASPDELLGLLK